MKRKDISPIATAMLHYTAPPVIGGVEAVIYSHCNVFNQFGYPVTVIAGRGDRRSLPPDTEFVSIEEMDSRQSEIQEMNLQLERGRVPDGFEDFSDRIYEKLKKRIGEYDVVIAHNLFTKHFNLPLTAALYRLIDAGEIKNCVAWCHDFTWTSERSRSKVHEGYPWDLLRKYHPDITHVTISEERKDSLVDLLGCEREKVQVIYNGVDAKTLLSLSNEGYRLVERLDLLDSDLNIIMPVRVTHAKNIEQALAIAKAIKKRLPSFRLILTGPPDPHDPKTMSYFRQLQETRDELGLDEVMRFIYESGPDPDKPYEIGFDLVGELMRSSDVMLMPSHQEGFGMPVLEAGLLGLMIFSTEVPAAQEIAKEMIQRFEPESDPEQVASQILERVENSKEHQFRRKVRREYRWQAVFRNQIEPLLKGRGWKAGL